MAVAVCKHILIGRQVTTTKPASEAPARRGLLNLDVAHNQTRT